MKIMSDDIIKPESANDIAGSSEAKVDPDKGTTSGESTQKIDAKNYEELEKLVGTQGEELGGYREFFKEVSPLLDKLNEQPELVSAILEGKVSADLVKSINEGKIKLEDAKIVSKANEDVKKDLGEKKYSEKTPEEIEKLIKDKVEESTNALRTEFNEKQELKEFEESVTEFIASKSDFAEHAKDVEKWLDEHNSDDIEGAYEIVKAKGLNKKKDDEDQKNKSDASKEIAANMSGGSSQSATHIKKDDLIDSLIARKSDPNRF